MTIKTITRRFNITVDDDGIVRGFYNIVDDDLVKEYGKKKNKKMTTKKRENNSNSKKVDRI